MIFGRATTYVALPLTMNPSALGSLYENEWPGIHNQRYLAGSPFGYASACSKDTNRHSQTKMAPAIPRRYASCHGMTGPSLRTLNYSRANNLVLAE
jgi:hypothetical protein